MLELIVKEKFEITGRGTVLTISLAENKLNYYQKLIGQLLEYEEEVYRILSIETLMFLTHPPRPKDIIGLVVRPETPSNERFTYKYI